MVYLDLSCSSEQRHLLLIHVSLLSSAHLFPKFLSLSRNNVSGYGRWQDKVNTLPCCQYCFLETCILSCNLWVEDLQPGVQEKKNKTKNPPKKEHKAKNPQLCSWSGLSLLVYSWRILCFASDRYLLAGESGFALIWLHLEIVVLQGTLVICSCQECLCSECPEHRSWHGKARTGCCGCL